MALFILGLTIGIFCMGFACLFPDGRPRSPHLPISAGIAGLLGWANDPSGFVTAGAIIGALLTAFWAYGLSFNPFASWFSGKRHDQSDRSRS